MSRQVRRGVTAVLLAGLLLGAPLLANEMANAGQTRPRADQKSHPGQVSATPSAQLTPIAEPISANPVVPSRGSAVPDAGSRPRIQIKRPGSHRASKTKTRGGTGSSVPSFAGKPPGAKKAGVRGVPRLDLPSPTDSPPAAPDRPRRDIATEQVARTEPMSANGLAGLLAAVSVVLVLGVSAGVIRAIASERASRTKMA